MSTNSDANVSATVIENYLEAQCKGCDKAVCTELSLSICIPILFLFIFVLGFSSFDVLGSEYTLFPSLSLRSLAIQECVDEAQGTLAVMDTYQEYIAVRYTNLDTYM